MRGTDQLTRRAVVKLAAVVGAATPLAGCLGEEEVPTEEEPDDEQADDDPAEAEPDPERWADVTELVFETDITVWVGDDPALIEGEENPTLVLSEGEEYTFTWENTDGFRHNVELWDEDATIVDDYATDPIETEGESQTLRFEAISEMAEYVCEPHQTTMRGDIEIV